MRPSPRGATQVGFMHRGMSVNWLCSATQQRPSNWLRSATTLPSTSERPPLRPGLASFGNYASVHPVAAPAQDWVRSATTPPCTRRRLRPRIGFVPQLRFRGPGGRSGSGLASFRLFGRRPVVGFVPASSFLVTDPIRPALEDLFPSGACSGRNR